MKKKLTLPVQILIALLLGIGVGIVCYAAGLGSFTKDYLKPFGDIFVNLLKFIVVPVVLFSMIEGILSMGDMKKVGAVGWENRGLFHGHHRHRLRHRAGAGQRIQRRRPIPHAVRRRRDL